ELTDRVHQFWGGRTQPDPHADRHPDETRNRNQHDNPRQREKAEPDRTAHVLGAERGAQIVDREPGRIAGESEYDEQPNDIRGSREPAESRSRTSIAEARQPQPRQARERLREARDQPAQQPPAAHDVEYPRPRPLLGRGLLEAKLVGPGDDRPEQQLIV